MGKRWGEGRGEGGGRERGVEAGKGFVFVVVLGLDGVVLVVVVGFVVVEGLEGVIFGLVFGLAGFCFVFFVVGVVAGLEGGYFGLKGKKKRKKEKKKNLVLGLGLGLVLGLGLGLVFGLDLGLLRLVLGLDRRLVETGVEGVEGGVENKELEGNVGVVGLFVVDVVGFVGGGGVVDLIFFVGVSVNLGVVGVGIVVLGPPDCS